MFRIRLFGEAVPEGSCADEFSYFLPSVDKEEGEERGREKDRGWEEGRRGGGEEGRRDQEKRGQRREGG